MATATATTTTPTPAAPTTIASADGTTTLDNCLVWTSGFFVCDNNWLARSGMGVEFVDFKRLWFPCCDPTLPRVAVSPDQAEGAVSEATWLPSCLQSLVLQSNPVQNVRAAASKFSDEISPEEADYAGKMRRWGSGEHMDLLNLLCFFELQISGNLARRSTSFGSVEFWRGTTCGDVFAGFGFDGMTLISILKMYLVDCSIDYMNFSGAFCFMLSEGLEGRVEHHAHTIRTSDVHKK